MNTTGIHPQRGASNRKANRSYPKREQFFCLLGKATRPLYSEGSRGARRRGPRAAGARGDGRWRGEGSRLITRVVVRGTERREVDRERTWSPWRRRAEEVGRPGGEREAGAVVVLEEMSKRSGAQLSGGDDSASNHLFLPRIKLVLALPPLLLLRISGGWHVGPARRVSSPAQPRADCPRAPASLSAPAAAAVSSDFPSLYPTYFGRAKIRGLTEIQTKWARRLCVTRLHQSPTS